MIEIMNNESQRVLNFFTDVKSTNSTGKREAWDMIAYSSKPGNGGTHYLAISDKFIKREKIILSPDPDGRSLFHVAISPESLAVVFNPYRDSIPEGGVINFRSEKVKASTFFHYKKKLIDAIGKRLLKDTGYGSLKFKLVRDGVYDRSPKYKMELINI